MCVCVFVYMCVHMRMLKCIEYVSVHACVWHGICMFILDPDLECHLLTFFRLLVVFCHILSTPGE